ncbi:unnamed protein product [Camellia sinensis]
MLGLDENIVGIEIPKIDVRFQNLSVAGDAYVGSSALPTLLNSTMNAIEWMTLLLGPLGSGKTTLLKALAGKSDDNLKRTNIRFLRTLLGVGTRYKMLVELSRREKEAGIKPNPEIDAFMKATAVSGQETSLITDYVLKKKEWPEIWDFWF